MNVISILWIVSLVLLFLCLTGVLLSIRLRSIINYRLEASNLIYCYQIDRILNDEDPDPAFDYKLVLKGDFSAIFTAWSVKSIFKHRKAYEIVKVYDGMLDSFLQKVEEILSQWDSPISSIIAARLG